ncbi:Glycosyltransferase involved in cell wall bisynthesis [Actinopolymorpha cephalotaxi]|uniref:Glycosyltransferase involved in cell wall biosynthesis n=1 Tax=Actinopolymorpha cephalotaxi TaxID=504797 RepID=A0A1I2XMF9_9ACTN|nr:glycosyltransferase family 4 protein [Actinopolymorpha cephalotaxi]NYH86276.1 glycosyltransferase involved in cell wall biosynthesis [Actinopolymorpha cephalotaxi]SFH13261.1 Glycosyltransferase involved in cell wall bisynthesis [Actinopolymorpha cephalotaxi]
MSFADDLARRGRALARQRLSPRARRRLRELQRAVLGRQTAIVARTGLSAARASLGAGEYAEAAARVEAVLRRDPRDEAALDLGLRVATKRGAVTEAGSYAVARAERTQLPAHWREARRAVGRATETDPRWRPVVTAPAPREYDAHPGRVLYVAKESRPYLHNGFCTRSHESLRALAREGWDVVGVTEPGFPGTLDATDGSNATGAPDRSVVEGVTYHHLLPNAGRRLRDLGHDEYASLAAAALAGVVARERPALLHVSSGHRGYETALAAGAVARWAGLPWLYEVRSFFETTWTSDAGLAETAEYPRRRFATETAMMREADLILTLSSPMRDEIVERHGIPADKVRVVPNGVDLDRFAPRPRDPALRRKLGLTDTFTLGYVSNLSHPREGQEVLIEAVARLRARGRAVTGLLVGDGGRRGALEDLARRLDVAEHVVFTGNVPFDEVAGHYAQIDLFVVPRVDERAARMVSPMKPFEAMAMRVPVLVADLPALTEIVGSTPEGAEGQRGLTFRAGQAGALAAAAAELMDDVPTRQLLVDNAAKWVATERSWDAVAGAFAQAYADLLRPRRPDRWGPQARPGRTAEEGSAC